MTAARAGGRARRHVRGLTLLEVMLASVVVTMLILGAAAAFSETVGGARIARQLTSGVLCLETVTENVRAQPPANLLALHGNQSFDGPVATRSEYRVDVAVFEVEPNESIVYGTPPPVGVESVATTWPWVVGALAALMFCVGRAVVAQARRPTASLQR